jgi:Ca2+-binding RTX toxin-like protein
LVLTDPVSGVTATFSIPSINGTTISATFSGGASAIAQALDSLGVVTVPLSQLGQNLSSVAGASLLTESITRNSSNNFDVTFQNGGSPSPNGGARFMVTATNSDSAFDYAVPAPSQTLVEIIDNGVGNATGRVVVLGSSATTLTGGSAVPGVTDKWVDTINGYQYQFEAASADSDQGTLVVSNGLLGAGGNEIAIDNFNIETAHGPSGYLGIVLPETLSLNASANAGVDPPAPNFQAGSDQSYTLSIDAPSTTAQTFTATLSGAAPSDFEVTVGDTIEQINANGSFSIALAAGETNVSFGLIDTTAANGSSDIASGANLQLIASLPNSDTLNGSTIQSTPLTFSYIPQGSDNAPAPQATDPILGNFDSTTGVTTYTGDGGDDFIAASGSENLIDAQNSGNDIISGGSSSNTIEGSAGNNVITVGGTSDRVDLGSGFNTVNGGSGHDSIESASGDAIINANNGTDLILLGSGNNAIYAGAQTSLANAIAQAASGSATNVQGDLIAVHDGNNTIVGGNGNDLIDVGAGHDVIVLGPGNDTFVGGEEVTSESANCSTTITPPTGTSN